MFNWLEKRKPNMSDKRDKLTAENNPDFGQTGDGKQQEAREVIECGKSFETLCNLPRGHKGMCTFECQQPSHASGEPGQDAELNDVCATLTDREAELLDAYIQQVKKRAFQRGQQAMAEKAAQVADEAAQSMDNEANRAHYDHSDEDSANSYLQQSNVAKEIAEAIRSLAGAEPISLTKDKDASIR